MTTVSKKALAMTIVLAASEVWAAGAMPATPTTPATSPVATTPVAPMTPSAAFALGKQDGSTGASVVGSVINSTSASTQVDAYSTSNTNSSYFAAGNGDPRTPGSARVTNCLTTVYSSPQDQAECAAIQQIANDRTNRPVTPLTPADPILVKGRATAADPTSVAGAFKDSFSACSTQVVTTPPVYETEFCTEEKTLGTQTCTKTLTVAITTTQCTPGETLFTYTDSRDSIRVVCDADPSRLRVIADFDGWCYTDYKRYTHAAAISVDPVPVIVQKGSISYYLKGRGAARTINGPIATMYPDQNPNNVLFGSFFRRGCMLELKPSVCDEAAESCTLNFRFINQYNFDDSYFANIDVVLNAAAITTPRHHTEVDSWETSSCDILQARTTP